MACYGKLRPRIYPPKCYYLLNAVREKCIVAIDSMLHQTRARLPLIDILSSSSVKQFSGSWCIQAGPLQLHVLARRERVACVPVKIGVRDVWSINCRCHDCSRFASNLRSLNYPMDISSAVFKVSEGLKLRKLLLGL
jgi:hypothetical protein